MPLINISMKHGQTPDVARANFERAIGEASVKFGMWIRRVDWSADRTTATLSGTGFEVKLWYDAESVHATGDVPFFARFLAGPLKGFLEDTFRKGLSRR